MLLRVAATCVALSGLLLCGVVLAAPPAAALDGEPSCRVTVTVPDIDVRRSLTYYRGSPDDGPGTRIQNRGLLASPQGPKGGVAAGEIGNLFIAGHRNTAGGPLLRIRELGRGDVVRVRERCDDGTDTTYAYTLTSKPRYLDFFTRLPGPPRSPEDDPPARVGMANAIYGSLLLMGLSAVFAVPVGLLTAVFLAEYRSDYLGPTVRFIGELLGGVRISPCLTRPLAWITPRNASSGRPVLVSMLRSCVWRAWSSVLKGCS